MYIPRYLVVRDMYSSAPAAQDYVQVNPTLLVSWWCTGFSLVIILLRLSGRYIRTEKLFMEDKIMFWSVIPLLGRMACVHLVIRWGTNNVIVTGLSPQQLWQREVGSKLVLPARILYAAFLWTAKWTISEFLKRMYRQVWKRSYEIGLQIVRWFLLATFAGVVLATLLECHPFNHYWQVDPDPGPSCRQGYVQLMTMGVTDIITDIALVAFPIPIIIASNMRLKRKISLVLLFGLSLILVGITSYRISATIDHHSDQVFRSLLASLEILAAAAVSNALVLGSFVRDRGVKKQKWKFGSTSGSSVLDRPSMAKTRTRAAFSWGSDIDLVGDLGMRLGPEFSSQKSNIARPAPAVLPLDSCSTAITPGQSSWTFPGRASIETDETDLKARDLDRDNPPSPRDVSVLTPRRMSFFDVGGLLGDDAPRRTSSFSISAPSSATFSLRPLLSHGTIRQRSPRGSRILLEDVGAFPDAPRPFESFSEPPSAFNQHFG